MDSTEIVIESSSLPLKRESILDDSAESVELDVNNPTEGGGGKDNNKPHNTKNIKNNSRVYSRTSGFGSTIDAGHHSGRIWLHAFYHSVVVSIGAGVLSLPYATAHLGYGGAVAMALIVSSGSYYTATLLISLQTPDQGTYSEVADAIMGGTWFSRRVVRPFQILYIFPISAVFLVLGGNAMYEMDRITSGNDSPAVSEKVWVSIVSAILSLSYFCVRIILLIQ
jgi:hypothetical protein